MQYKDEVAIIDGERQYFRPSIYKMEEEMNYEVNDYKKGLLKDAMEDMTVINHSYDRVCFIRKRMAELECMKSENSIDIMVLLGIEHKLIEQLQDVEGFICHYMKTTNRLKKELTSFKQRVYRLFLCRRINYIEIPKIQQLNEQLKKMKLFTREKNDLELLHQFIRGKILYLTDNNIQRLGIIRD